MLNKREENNRRLEELLQDEKVKEYASILKDNESIRILLRHEMENCDHVFVQTERVTSEDIEEVIMATNPDVEGDVTATYISKLLKPLGIKVTRLAQGIQMGSDLQYADEVTLGKALQDRREI